MTSNVDGQARQKRFENATCGRGFFRKRISKISGYVWTGKNDLNVDAHFFENGRNKAPFSKISGYLWESPLFTFHEKQEAESLRDFLPSWSIL